MRSPNGSFGTNRDSNIEEFETRTSMVRALVAYSNIIEFETRTPGDLGLETSAPRAIIRQTVGFTRFKTSALSVLSGISDRRRRRQPLLSDVARETF